MDPRRLVPRTDAVLADPRLAEAARRLGRARVKAAALAAAVLAAVPVMADRSRAGPAG